MASARKLAAGLNDQLEDGEVVVAFVAGTYEALLLGRADTARSGVLAVTDRRVVMYGKKVGGFEMESVSISSIAGVAASKNAMGTAIAVTAVSGARLSLKWIHDKAAVETFMSAVNNRSAQANLPPPTPGG